jgi:23S rRNA pseudouridine2605 synthase
MSETHSPSPSEREATEGEAPVTPSPAAGEATQGDPQHPGEGGAEGPASPRKRRRRRSKGGAQREGGDRPETAFADDDDEVSDDAEDGQDGADAAAEPDEPIVGLSFDDVVGGAIDEEEPPAGAEEPTKRVLRPTPDQPKLHKVLAQAGLGSRLEMEQFIQDGMVTVNGETAHLGQRVQFGDVVKLDGKVVRLRIRPPAPRVLAYHKPAGEIVSRDDPENRPTVFRKLPRLPQGKWQAVGRLDLNTEGLLLFTNSGELANQLMHPRFGIEREYAVRVLGELTSESRERLLEGVEIAIDNPREPHRKTAVAAFKAIDDGGGDGANRWYRVVIGEGRNREVRKLFEAVGLVVSRLIRIRYGAVMLPRGLKRGVWMELGDRDVKAIEALARPERDDRRDAPPREEGGRNRPKNGRRGGRDRRDGGREQPEFRRDDDSARHPASTQRDDPWEAEDDHEPGDVNGNRIDIKGDPHAGTARLGGRNKGRGARQPGGPGGDGQPDPMKTAFGYIGSDSFFRQGGGGGRGGGGGGRRSGGGGGWGGPRGGRR